MIIYNVHNKINYIYNSYKICINNKNNKMHNYKNNQNNKSLKLQNYNNKVI